MRLAANAAHAVTRYAVRWAAGERTRATLVEIVRRAEACAGCEHLKFIKGVNRCMKCGCWLDGKHQHKWYWASESCPLPEPRWRAQP